MGTSFRWEASLSSIRILKMQTPKEENGTVLTIDYLRENPTIDIPVITADNIQDRSKGDVLFKLIAILQTT